MSQQELAIKSKLHHNYISDLERGTRNVSLKAIYALAKTLNLSLEEVFKNMEE